MRRLGHEVASEANRHCEVLRLRYCNHREGNYSANASNMPLNPGFETLRGTLFRNQREELNSAKARRHSALQGNVGVKDDVCCVVREIDLYRPYDRPLKIP